MVTCIDSQQFLVNAGKNFFLDRVASIRLIALSLHRAALFKHFDLSRLLFFENADFFEVKLFGSLQLRNVALLKLRDLGFISLDFFL